MPREGIEGGEKKEKGSGLEVAGRNVRADCSAGSNAMDNLS